jgi:hypothetical protein
MFKRSLRVLAVLVAGVGIAAEAQSQIASSQPQPAQTAAPSPPQSVSTSTNAKKVWTNDDLSDVHNDAAVPAFSGASVKPYNPRQSRVTGPRTNAGWYRSQIATLQAKIPPLDSQIASLQAALDGKPTGDGKESTRPYYVHRADWRVQLDKLTTKRSEIQNQIEALREDARHAGVPTNQLP